MPKSKTKPDPGLEDLLQFIKTTRGFDFTGYKRSTLARRIQRRMQDLRITDYGRYREYLAEHPAEAEPLFNTILINVTSFFRDLDAWEFLSQHVVPRILECRGPTSPVRVWSAGCAAGHEPYSVAITFAETMGLEDFSRRVKVYATDLDDNALDHARTARYTEHELEGLPEPLRTKYFQQEADLFTLHPMLRRSVIFGKHDLVEDAPIPHLDLLLCRNALMYFNAEAQSHIVERLHFALEPHGYLFLGRAEMLLSHGDLFTPVELKHRIFAKAPLPDGQFYPVRAQPRHAPTTPEPVRNQQHRLLKEVALDAAPVAQIVLDVRSQIVHCNRAAQAMFRLGREDLQKPLRDLELSYRPLELRLLIDEARETRQPVLREGVEHRLHSGETCFLDVHIVPLYRDTTPLGLSISFDDVTECHHMQGNLQRFAENLETAYEELQSANEELETTNEEIQSANEELETTNEELQSANEEMETMNEELRSTNDELSTANDQLRERRTQLEHTNSFLRLILESLDAGVVVLDEQMRVMIWNERSAEMWGLRSEEVEGAAFLSLDFGLPVRELEDPLRACMGPGPTGRQVHIQGHNRRGRALNCLVRINPLAADHLPGQRAILLMQEVEVDGEAEEEEEKQ